MSSDEELTCSVVIVTHDRGTDILSRALGSVLNQTRRPLEVLVVDSGTAEHRSRTSAFVDSLDTSGVPVRVVGDRESGAPVARNLGASLSQGEFVAFLDDDDEWYPDKLSSQLAVLSDEDAMVYSPYDEEVGEVWREYRCEDKWYPAILERNIVGSTSFPVVRKRVFLKTDGFDPSFPSNQEWDLWMRLMRSNHCVYCDVPAGRKHAAPGITSDDGRRLRGWKAIFRKHRQEYRENPDAHAKAARTFYNDMSSRRVLTGVISAKVEMHRK